jgi:phosphoribosylanthranilate isomerase
MTISVKICGLTSAGAADAAARAGAAYGGLVFHAASPRCLTLEAARAVAEAMRGRLKTVALVADADDAALEAVVAAVRPDILQLHGHESVARTAEIRARFERPVIKALAVADAGDLKAAAAFETAADMLLFDAKAPKGAARMGGHGAEFDWTLLRARSFTRPWFLAGGLTPQNIARALEASGAAMVDVSSGVESAPGVKSAERIAAFVAATKAPVSP